MSGVALACAAALLAVERLSTAFADHVIAPNHIWQQRLIGRSVAEAKCSVFMNYPDPNVFRKRGRSRLVQSRVVESREREADRPDGKIDGRRDYIGFAKTKGFHQNQGGDGSAGPRAHDIGEIQEAEAAMSWMALSDERHHQRKGRAHHDAPRQDGEDDDER